jgi:hypothetical protein
LGDVDKLLTDALSETGQVERSYFGVPGGFALVTRLEQINPDGSSKSGDDRWATTTGPLHKFSLDAYLKALFGSAPGYFRVIVFTVTDQPFSVTGNPITEGTAIGWLGEGLNRLSGEIAVLPYTANHACTALIYEFETAGGANAPTVIVPGRLGGLVHLQKLGILQYLQTP